MSETLRDRVRYLVQAGYPQGAKFAAEAIGIPNATLHKILHGNSENPRGRTLQAIATTFGTSVAWLLEGTGPMPSLMSEAPPMAATQAVLDTLGLRPKARAQVLGLSELFRNVDDALSWQERIGDQPKGMDAQLALYAKRRERGRLVDEALAVTLEAFILKVGKSRARERLEDPEIWQLLAAVQHPLDREGRTRAQSMEEIAAQARQPRADAPSKRPAVRKRG